MDLHERGQMQYPIWLTHSSVHRQETFPHQPQYTLCTTHCQTADSALEADPQAGEPAQRAGHSACPGLAPGGDRRSGGRDTFHVGPDDLQRVKGLYPLRRGQPGLPSIARAKATSDQDAQKAMGQLIKAAPLEAACPTACRGSLCVLRPSTHRHQESHGALRGTPCYTPRGGLMSGTLPEHLWMLTQSNTWALPDVT
jgi:hypothetical protein